MNPKSLAPQSLIPALKLLIITEGMNLLAVILILVIGWFVAAWMEKLVGRGLDRIHRLDSTLKPLMRKTVRYGILLFTLLAVLERSGVQTASLIALLGAAGLALGLALQGTLSDVAAGFMLLLLRPFHIGDTIHVGDQVGTVSEVGLFQTYMITPDMIFLSMPNSKIFGSPIINYSRAPTRRINITVGIDYADDIDKAQRIALDLLQNDPRIMKNPAPVVPVGELGESSVNLIVRGYVAAGDYWNTLFDLQKAIKLAFDKAGIAIPFPQQTVGFRSDSPGPFSAPEKPKS
jgi:small conductance mechanosensitive channel